MYIYIYIYIYILPALCGTSSCKPYQNIVTSRRVDRACEHGEGLIVATIPIQRV